MVTLVTENTIEASWATRPAIKAAGSVARVIQDACEGGHHTRPFSSGLVCRLIQDNGSVQGYRDDGVVLRTQKLGEADRIITLLTRHNGRVRAVARGIRRTKSRFGARLEPFTHVDVMVHPGRSLDVITQAEVIRAYGTALVSDYPKYTAGTAMLETAERFTPVEKEPAIRQFLLLIGGLRALGDAVE